jgi:GT2 family glycosyltransferase
MMQGFSGRAIDRDANTTISFVIPVRNDAVRLARCLETIAASAPPGLAMECLVVDNGSTDGSIETAQSRGAQALSAPGLKVSALRNRGASQARGRILAFVDADHEIAPAWIRAALDLFDDARIGAAGALYLPPPNGTWVQRLYGVLRGRTEGRGDVQWLGSGNLAVRREVFHELGGFDDTLETCEDVDFCQRIRARGWRLVGDDRLESVHMGDPGTLRELFFSERWRGRDNLRVSLRSLTRLSDLPSVLIPVVDALALMTASLGLVMAPVVGRGAAMVAAGSIGLIVLGALLRSSRMIVRGRLHGLPEWARAAAVALVYDLGRACSLVWPANHRRLQPEPSRSAAPRTP